MKDISIWSMNDPAYEGQSIRIRNLWSTVFISVLAMALWAEAETRAQRGLATAIAGRDQSVLGAGNTGFHLEDLPWSHDSFAADKAFFDRSIERALSQVDWDRLSYEAPEYWASDALRELQTMVESLPASAIAPNHRVMQLAREGEEQCPAHKVPLHQHGCVVCNNS